MNDTKTYVTRLLLSFPNRLQKSPACGIQSTFVSLTNSALARRCGLPPPGPLAAVWARNVQCFDPRATNRRQDAHITPEPLEITVSLTRWDAFRCCGDCCTVSAPPNAQVPAESFCGEHQSRLGGRVVIDNATTTTSCILSVDGQPTAASHSVMQCW